MLREKLQLFILVIVVVGSRSDDTSLGEPHGGCYTLQQYETLKKLAELEVKNTQMELALNVQKHVQDSQQNLITKLQEQLTGLETKIVDTYYYKDQIAQASCTALLSGNNYIFAVRRQCSAQAADCTELCKSLGKTCFNAVHVYAGKTLENGATGAVGLQTYKYNGCGGGCGPNYCCCSGS